MELHLYNAKSVISSYNSKLVLVAHNLARRKLCNFPGLKDEAIAAYLEETDISCYCDQLNKYKSIWNTDLQISPKFMCQRDSSNYMRRTSPVLIQNCKNASLTCTTMKRPSPVFSGRDTETFGFARDNDILCSGIILNFWYSHFQLPIWWRHRRAASVLCRTSWANNEIVWDLCKVEISGCCSQAFVPILILSRSCTKPKVASSH